MKRKRRFNFKIIILLIILAIPMYLYISYNNSLKAVSNNDEVVDFVIDNGSGVKDVINNLYSNNLIKDKNYAYIFVKMNNLTNIKAGNYVLNRSYDLKTIFNILNDSSKAKSDDVSITIIEGDWAKDIARKISANTNISEQELIDLWNDKEYIQSLKETYPFISDEVLNDNIRIKLEGYLFPNTYRFFKETDKYAVTSKMLDETLKVYNKYKDQIDSSNLSVHQLFTLASIVQYEAGSVEDMKTIAGVFYNRLNIDMMLQSSVTVCYAIDKEKDDDWKKCEYNPDFDSLYNTYKYKGLPPGPILNPGEMAIEAVLNPSDSDYLYFMADVYGDGKVYYAKTLAEHEENVRRYLK